MGARTTGRGATARDTVLRSTVQVIRLRHGILHKPSQSHQRRIPGCLTVSQLTATLGVTKHWIYDRIHNGTIVITPDAHTGLYLFPDVPRTLSAFRKLKAGKLERLTFDPRSAC